MDIALRAPADQRDGELAPDSVMPCQFDDRLAHTARLQPEKRLQLAVLQDAVLTFHRLAGLKGRRPARLFAEIEDWFASGETNDPFTFVTICDTLHLDPDYIRGGLRRWRMALARGDRRTPPLRRESMGMRHRVGPTGRHRAEPMPLRKIA